jgi:hypothetical protein
MGDAPNTHAQSTSYFVLVQRSNKECQGDWNECGSSGFWSVKDIIKPSRGRKPELAYSILSQQAVKSLS